MRLRRVILNSVRGKSIVQKFNKGNMQTPIEEVVYVMSPLPALTHYFMQFIMKDYMWEKYPRYIQGTLRSNKVCNVFYYDKLEDCIIRSSPYCDGDKWKFHKKSHKSVLPERKKHLVLKKVGDKCGNTSTENDTKIRRVNTVSKIKSTGKADVGMSDSRNIKLRTGVPKIKPVSAGKRVTESKTGREETAMVIECSRRPVQRKTIRRLPV